MFEYFAKRVRKAVRPTGSESPARNKRQLTAQLRVAQLEDRVTPATLHWLGSAAANGNLWSVASNWLENRTPVSGDRLAFDTTTPGFAAVSNGFAPSNDLSGLTNLTIGINDASAAGDFAITGTAFGLTTTAGTGVTSTLSVGTVAAISNNIALGANTTVSVGLGALTLGGIVSGAFSLTSAGSPAATLTLNAANTYTGGTVLTSGTISVNTNTSLGTGALTFNGGTLAPATSFLVVPNAFVVAAPSTIGGGGFFTLSGNGTLNATLALANTGFLALNGALSGPGGLNEIGFPGGTTLGGTAPNTFTGGTTITFGGITLAKTAGVNAVASPVTIVGSFASLTLGANNQLNGAPVSIGQGGTFSTNGFSDTVTSLTGLGALSTGSTTTAGLTVTGGGLQVLTGAVSGSGLVTYNGPGTLALTGASASYTGTLTAAAGTLLVGADFSGATAKVTGGTVAGTGVVKSITATSGFVNPGAVGTGGTLATAAGAVATSLTGATLRADLTPQGPADHLVLGANATLNLTGAALALGAVVPAFTSTYQIITSSTGGISGTFTSLPDGSTLVVAGATFRINYTATAVTLTNLGAGTRTLHWTGAAGSNWSAAGNWSEGTVPLSGDTLVFDTSAPGFAATTAAFAPSNDISGLTNIALVINDNSAAGDFAIGGSALGLVTTAGIGLTSTVTAGTAAVLNTPLTLTSNTTVNVGIGSLTLGGAIGGGFALLVAGSPAGTLTLNVANTYSGGTVLSSGTVAVNTNTSLGSGTVTLSGGTLANAAAFLRISNPLVVSSLSTIGGGSFFDFDGTILLNANLRLTNTGFLTLIGPISGTGGLIEDGFPGSTTLSGAAANTFTGPTTILTGGLKLSKSPGVNAIVGPITLAGGSFPTLSWGASNQLNGTVPITLGIGSKLSTSGFSDSLAALSGIGAVDLASTTTQGLTVTGSGASLLTGAVSGSGFLTYNGTGSLTLAGTSASYTGRLTAAQGSLAVSADFSGATATELVGGTLGGTGVVKTLPATGTGSINPGGTGTGGILTLASGTNSLSGQTLRLDISDNALSDQLVVGASATLDLTNATLNLNLIRSAPNNIHTIITSPSGGITGTFNGLPNASTLTVGGRVFRINYTPTAVTLTDLQTVTLTPATLPGGEVGLAYSQTITPVGGAAPVTLAVSGVTNPTGLTITGSGTGTVTVSGTPTSAGTVTFTVTPTDANGPQAPAVYSFTVSPAVVLTPLTLPTGEVGTAYNQTITSSGGAAPVTLAVSGITNPTGITISGSGTGTITLSGNPSSAGTVTFTVTPTDAVGSSAPTVYTFAVGPAITLTPATLPAGEVNLAYNRTITASGGSGAITLAVSGVTNPTGLTIAGSGTGTITVSGTPTSAGTVTFTVTPTDTVGSRAGRVYSFTVSPPVVLTPATLPDGPLAVPYSQTITGSGGSGAITLAVSGITNPTGITISGSGTGTITLSGTPNAVGTVSFTVTPTDAIGTGPGRIYTFAVSTLTATAAVSSSSNPSVPGAALTFTARLTPARPTDPTPTGTVQFFDGITPLGSPKALVAGTGNTAVASVATDGILVPFLLAGAHSITTKFTPTTGSAYQPATSPVLAQQVTVASAVTLTAQSGPSVLGDAVSFVAAVNPVAGAPTPSGTVQFTNAAGAVLFTTSLSSAGQATFSTTALPVGTSTVTVSYSGDSFYRSSFASATQVVTRQNRIVLGSDAGPVASVGVYDARTGVLLRTLTPFDNYTGGAKVATGDINNDGIADIIVSAGAGAPGGHVKVYNGATYAEIASFLTFVGFNGGVNVAAGDVDGDGFADLVIGTANASDHVKAFAGKSLSAGVSADASTLMSFFAYSDAGGNPVGVTVGAGDVDGDGKADIITGSANAAGHLKVFKGGAFVGPPQLLLSTLAYGSDYQGGIFVAGGDTNGDGLAEVITGATNAPHVKVLNRSGTELASFLAFTNNGQPVPIGARVGAADVNGDRLADILVGAGGIAPLVLEFSGLDPLQIVGNINATLAGQKSAGVFVGGSTN